MYLYVDSSSRSRDTNAKVYSVQSMTDNCSVQLLSWYSVSDPYSVVEFNQLDEKLYDK